MPRSIFAFTVAAALVAAGCRDSTATTSPADSTPLSDAFLSIPAGYDVAVSSFAGGSSNIGPWMPMQIGEHGAMGGLGPMRGRMMRFGRLGVFDPGLMGGGLGPAFLGGIGFGRGFLAGPFHFDFDDIVGDCTFDSGSGRVVCPTATRGGLSIDRSFAFLDGGDQPQSTPDNTTNTINVMVDASGTLTRGNGTSTVHNTSDRTVTGLASGSTERTVNGASRGEETTTGTSDRGNYTAVRLAGDTTTGLVIPLDDGHPTVPTSGTVIREMSVTFTLEGQTPVSSSRREVITYDGTNAATVVITQDGATKTCSLPLPFGRPNCQ